MKFEFSVYLAAALSFQGADVVVTYKTVIDLSVHWKTSNVTRFIFIQNIIVDLFFSDRSKYIKYLYMLQNMISYNPNFLNFL